MSKRGSLIDSNNGTTISAKRRKGEGHDMKDGTESKSNDEYTVGWICAISTEYTAAIAFLDEKFDAPEYTLPNDNNDYTLGRIGGHNVVITVLPEYGIAAAAAVARDMMRSFPNTRIRLMVGIGGGAPTSRHDICLGDVVVGVPRDSRSGVLQYDFGKTIQNQEFQMTGFLNQPPKNLLAAITGLRTHYNGEGHRLEEAIKEALQKSPRLRDKFQRPSPSSDKLYKSEVIHPPNDDRSCAMACGDATSEVVLRPERPEEDRITIHYGLIASANQVMKDAVIRDKLALENEVLCFEMEAAGLMNDDFSCLIVCGICDYSDSHKNKNWQGYAAMAAAAYAKDLICRIRPIQAEPSRSMVDIVASESRATEYPALRVNQLEMILKSLRFEQIGARYMTIKNAHAKTCKWLLGNQQYLDWLDPGKLDSHHGFLWIKGKPGTGKSTLMKFALTHAQRRMKDKRIISFYFNARGGDMEKCTTGMYRSLLLQLFELLPELQQRLYSFPIVEAGDDYIWNIPQLKCIFEEAIHNIQDATVLCFIDALDECDEDEIRDMMSFFQNVGEFTTSNNIKFLVCFSSRHYPHISKRNALNLTLEGQEGHEQDIINYLDNELKIGQSRLAKQIRVEIREKAAGIFMWVFLVVEILNKDFDRGRIHELRQRLRDIPGDLHELFRDILTRDDHRKDELLLCIQWLLFSTQPLAPEELYFAVLSGTLPEGADSWDTDGISVDDMKKFILSSSKGLAEITKSKSPTVQFIHESVKDFLLKEDGLKDIYTDLGDGFIEKSHDRLKQCCLRYLNESFVNLEVSISLPKASSKQASHLCRFTKKEFPFVFYVIQNILHHANAAKMDQDEQVIFFRAFPFVTWVTLSNLVEKFENRRYTQDVTLLYVLAKHNAENLIRYHPSKLSCFEIEKERYGPPIFAALANNGTEAVEVFLEAHVQASSESKVDASLLCQLYEQYRHKKNKRKWIGPDFNFHQRKGILSYLAEHNDATIATFWLNWAKIDINSQDKQGKTPLMWAAEKGNNNFFDLLLRHGADIKTKDEYGEMLLHKAAGNGHEIIVKLLLEAGADAKEKNNFDSSPLCSAAVGGHAAIVKLLLEAGADAQEEDKLHRSPLYEAAAKGHGAVVKLLLEAGADAKGKNNIDKSPLHEAAAEGHGAVVKLLLEAGANAKEKDRYGRSLLHEAAAKGHGAIVKLLLEAGANAKEKDRYGRSPLHEAAAKGHKAAVQLLYEAGADVNAKNNRGESPLHEAAAEGHGATVKLLLEAGADVNAKSNYGELPLHSSMEGVASHGSKESYSAVTELLRQSAADVNARDAGGQTPLMYAAGYPATFWLRNNTSKRIWWEAAVRLLFKKGADADAKNKRGETPLYLAARLSDEDTVKLLLENGANVNAINNSGRTPLHEAASRERGSEKVIVLLESGANIDAKDCSGATPLHDAAVFGRPEIVELLIAYNANLRLKHNSNRTPLELAQCRLACPTAHVKNDEVKKVIQLLEAASK